MRYKRSAPGCHGLTVGTSSTAGQHLLRQECETTVSHSSLLVGGKGGRSSAVFSPPAVSHAVTPPASLSCVFWLPSLLQWKQASTRPGQSACSQGGLALSVTALHGGGVLVAVVVGTAL